VDNASFSDYLAREDDIYKNLKENVTDKIPESEKTELNRYYENSLVYPPKFHQDWNRSYSLMPEGKPQGAVVLLHGLTDTPYSLTEMAALYQSKGFVVVAPRLPGHGTVPAGLTSVGRNEWLAVTRMAVREATAIAGELVPLHIVGFSNGGALAMKYTLSSLNDKTLRTPQQVILLSPMIGITSFARFAGLAGLPSIFPAFAKSAWLSIIPEFNPFKYNSFPVKAARESFLLTQELQQSIRELTPEGLHKVPPILTFQSVMDSTVSTRAVVNSLYRYLGANGSELVLFDINHAVSFPPLFRRSAYTAVNSLLPRGARNYNTIVITNLTPNSPEAVATVTRAGETRTL
ncbi:MAG: alpha/beta hydrolase, partial [Plesiomonas shigelloides]